MGFTKNKELTDEIVSDVLLISGAAERILGR